MRVRLVLASGLTLVAIAVAITLSHSPLSLAWTNGVPRTTTLASTEIATGACQAGEALPAATAAIRLGLAVKIGPRVAVEVLAGSHVVTRGTRGPGWNGGAVTIPVTPTRNAFAHVSVCFHLSQLNGEVGLVGTSTSPAVAATDGRERLPGRMSIAYLRAGNRSWWSLAAPVVAHMGLGRAASGTWIVFPIALLGATVVFCTAWVVLRELR